MVIFTHTSQQLSHDQNKVKNGNILKWIINEYYNYFFNVSLLLKFWASGFCWRTLYAHYLLIRYTTQKVKLAQLINVVEIAI